MRTFPRAVILGVALLSLPAISLCGEDGLLFHATFDGSTSDSGASSDSRDEPLVSRLLTHGEGPNGKPAIQVPVGGHLTYEGAGNAYIPSGTVSFWWRPDEAVQVKEADVLGLGSFQRFYFGRWLRIGTKDRRITATLYHGDGAEATADTAAFPSLGEATRKRNSRYELVSRAPLAEGEWHHVAATWDFGNGFAFYLDGKPVGKQPAPWFFGGAINHLSLACASSGYSKGRMASVAQSFADVRIYDGWMDEAGITALARGEEPVSAEFDFEPMLRERSRRLGLERKLSLPVENAASGDTAALWLEQTGIVTARDLMRNTYSGLDGDLGRAWPLYQGYTRSGEKLTVTMAPGARFNTVQLVGSGPMRVEAPDKTLLQFDSPRAELVSAFRDDETKAQEVSIVREAGLLFHTAFFNAATRPFPEAGDGWAFHPLGAVAAENAGEPLIPQEFAEYDRLVLAAGSAGTPPLKLEAGKAVHLLAPASELETGVGAIAIDLAVENPPAESDLCLMVVDPVSYERRAVIATFRSNGGGKQGRLRAVVDLRDLIYGPGQRPWVVLYPGTDLKIDPAQSRIGLRTISVAQARPEFVHDQLTLVNDAFQELSESRPWGHDPKRIKGLGSLLTRIDAVRRVDPENALAQGYWHWTHPKEDVPKPPLPAVPEGTPPWAVYTDRLVDLCRDAAYWWIDNRQSPEGEFGAPDGINDDTDLIQDWLAIDLMRGPDPKIREAIRKVADISWVLTTDGISNKVTDTLHMYEWGINAQTLAFVLEYGDPVYFERLLRFGSRYESLMAEACEGRHLHFKSWYFGADKIITEGVYGRDIQQNGLLLQPAMLLAWYNGDLASRDIVSRWTASMRDHVLARASEQPRVPGLAVAIPSGEVIPESHLSLSFPDAAWAAWRLTGDVSFRDYAGTLIDYEMKRKPTEGLHVTSSIAGAYLAETGDSRWDALWKEKASDPEVSRRSLHNSGYRPLDYFQAAWLRTGDDSWLDRGSALALSNLTWSLPMLTEAQATTDRVWLPQKLANEMTLGGLAILRNRIFPKHAVSWEHASGRFAPLVRKHSGEALAMEVCNLEERPLTVTSRLWALEAGVYEIHFRAVSRKDPGLSATEWTREMEVERYTPLPLEIPAGATATVTLRLKTRLPDFRQRPDLAASRLDALYDPAEGKLTVTVHNIGPLASGAFRVRAEQGGREIASRTFEPLPPPEAFRTRKARFEIPVPAPGAGEAVTVSITSEPREITTANNRLEIVPRTCPAKPL